MTIVIPGVVSFGLALALVLAVFAWIAHNPANAERIALWFWSGTRWVSKTAETKALQRDVTHGINDFAVRIQDELEGYRPRGIDLAFIGSDESPNSFLDRGRLVVRIRPRTGRDQNFLAVASLYVAHTVFPIVKHHLRKNQRESIDLRFTEKMVARERPDLLPEFIRAWLNPAIAGNEALERLVLQLNQLDEAGLFLPILCQELHFLSGRMLSSVEREKLRTEVQRFTEFLIRVAQRRVGEEIPLEYEGPHLRVVIQIVSKRVTREAKKGDIGPWLRFALKVVQTKRPDHIYFVGNAKEANKQLIEQVAKSFCLQTGWQWLCEREYNCKLHDADGQLVPVRNFMVVCEVAGRSPA